MGQYYKASSLDKKEHVFSHDYDNGLKLMEHSWVGNHYVMAVESLIAEGGAWYGDRIVWAGDYADPEQPKVLDPDPNYLGRVMNLYDMVSDNKVTPEIPDQEFEYLVNLDTKEFVTISKTPISDTYTDENTGEVFYYKIHPLPLLTCEGNGRGGGDFNGDSPLVGKWARQRVIATNTKPNDCTELIFDLIE